MGRDDDLGGYGEEKDDPYDPWSRRRYDKDRLNPGYNSIRKGGFSQKKDLPMPDWDNDDWESDWDWDFDFGQDGDAEPDGDKDDKK